MAYSGYEALNTATEALLASKGQGSNKQKNEAINDWLWKTAYAFRNDQEGFARWQQENPEMAIKFHAKGALDRYSGQHGDEWTGLTGKQHQQMAHALGLAYGQQMGMGDDMKENGRMLATDYNTFKDVQREHGPGDFWKIGTMQKLDKGFGAFVDNLDFKDIATMAAPFLLGPMVGPALAGLGLSPTATAALTNMAMQGLSGGDLKDILVSGATPYVQGGINNILGTVIGPDTVLGKEMIEKGWNPEAILDEIAKGGTDILKGKDWEDAVLGGIEDYVVDNGLGNLPGPGVGDVGDIFGDINLPDFPNVFKGVEDIFGPAGDIFGDINFPGLPDGAKDIFGDIGDIFGDLPGMPDWQGPDWNPNWPDMPNMPDVPMPGPPDPAEPGMVAQAPMAKPEPTELAQLQQPRLSPLIDALPFISQGMMKA